MPPPSLPSENCHPERSASTFVYAIVADGREVEGPRGYQRQERHLKAFSRELPDTPSQIEISSGSFDSPSSREAGLGLAQDDRGKAH